MEDEEVKREDTKAGASPQTIEDASPAALTGEAGKKKGRNKKTTGEAEGGKRSKGGRKTGGKKKAIADPVTVPEGTISVAEEGTGPARVTMATAPSVAVFQGAKVDLPREEKATVGSAAAATNLQTQEEVPSRVVKVHRIEAAIGEVNTRIVPDKVIVQGRVDLQIFFVTEAGEVHHLAEGTPFSSMLAIPGARPGMKAIVEPRVETVLFHLSEDGTTLVKKVLLEIFAKVVDEVQQNFLPGNGPLLLFDEVVGEATGQTLLENEVTLAIPALKVEEIRAELQEVTAEIIPDKVIVQGRIHKQIFFVDTAGMARHQAEDVPFTALLDLPGAAPGMQVRVWPKIEKVLFELAGPTLLREKVVVEVFAKVTTAVHFRATIGEGPLFRAKEIVGEGSGQLLRREVVRLERPAQKIREIVATLKDIKGTVIPGKAIVQGTVHKQIFFIGPDDIEYHQAEEVPFSLMIEIPGLARGAELVIEPTIASVLFNLLGPNELEEKVLVDLKLTAVEERQWRLSTGPGPLVLAEEVIGENIGQVLLRLVNRVPFAKRVVPITVMSTVQGQQVFREQIIVENEFTLPIPSIKIAEVRAEIVGLRAQVVTRGLVVEGTVVKEVKFVGEDEIVREVTEEVPFSLLVGIPAGFTPESVAVQIEEILFSLAPDGRSGRQVIVLSAEATALEVVTREIQLIRELVVPGLTVQSVLVEEPVLTPAGIGVWQFPVITGLSGPGLAEVVSATFGVHTLQVVGVGPQDLNVLEAITLRDP
ncbi:MAG: DUF3794 domain-containing protein [Firmicutes bacterium]|nr:DUF3794 domain-containing protein [Bacillota bacterium]